MNVSVSHSLRANYPKIKEQRKSLNVTEVHQQHSYPRLLLTMTSGCFGKRAILDDKMLLYFRFLTVDFRFSFYDCRALPYEAHY